MNFIYIKLDHRLSLVFPRHYRNLLYRIYTVEIGPKRPYFDLNIQFLLDIAWVGYIDPKKDFIIISLDTRIPLVVLRPSKTYLYWPVLSE